MDDDGDKDKIDLAGDDSADHYDDDDDDDEERLSETAAANGGRKIVVVAPPSPPPQPARPAVYKSLLDNVTVEPMLLPYLIASILVLLANQNLNIQKACRVELDLDVNVCAELENKEKNSSTYTGSEIAVQKLVANMLIWQTIIQSSVPAMFVLFLGSWSDRNRLRRPCMLLPIYGEMVRNAGLLVCVYYFDQIPMAATGLWQSLPVAVTGYWTVLFMAVFAYIGDISTVRPNVVHRRVDVGHGLAGSCSAVVVGRLRHYLCQEFPTRGWGAAPRGGREAFRKEIMKL